MTKKELNKLLTKVKKVQTIKNKIGKLRDELRDIFYEIDDLLDSVDRGEADLTNAVNDFESAIDSLSEYV